MSAIPLTPWLVLPVLVILIPLLVVVAMGVGGGLLIRRVARPKVARQRRPRIRGPRWRQGHDLLRYPERLKGLEQQLDEAWRSSTLQIRHLDIRRRELEDKGGRGELVGRYADDQAVLQARMASIEGVMATVWKTRAILLLRVHVAVAARQRPDLEHLPQPLDVSPKYLESAALSYAQASAAVREFVSVIDDHRRVVSQIVPAPSSKAAVDAETRLAVEAELAGAERTLEGLRERMDELADNLAYLADRLRTQHLFEGSAAIEIDPESGQLLSELSMALDQLDELSAVGDRGLADVAVGGLVADIDQLELAGLEIDAEAEASREVERLLASFTKV